LIAGGVQSAYNNGTYQAHGESNVPYSIPELYAFAVDVAFWEVVFRKCASGEPLELRREDFDFLDSYTYEKRLAEALSSGALEELPNGSYRLVEHLPQSVHVPKPEAFVDNDWHSHLMAVGVRSLWTVNYLVLERWTAMGQGSFDALLAELSNTPFHFTLRHLKQRVEAARSRHGQTARLEELKPIVHFLARLGVLVPVDPDSFWRPRRNQTWSFRLEMSAFLVHPAPDAPVAQWEAEYLELKTFAHDLMRTYEFNLLLTNPAKTPVNIDSARLLRHAEARLLSARVHLSLRVTAVVLLRSFLGQLEARGFIRRAAAGALLLSPIVGNAEQMNAVVKETQASLRREVERARITGALGRFRAWRDAKLADLVAAIALDCYLQSSICASLFLYLESRLIQPDLYEDFRGHCRAKDNGAILMAGDLDLLWERCRARLPSLRRSPNRQTERRTFRMSRSARFAELRDLPSGGTISGEMQVTLSYDRPLQPDMEGTRLSVVLMEKNGHSIHEQVVCLVDVSPERSEKLPPTIFPPYRLSGESHPTFLRVGLPRPLETIQVGVVLRFGQV
jgi:hypothetical protein